ncbi:MAG: NAD(P)/FAD-dependent oxidoreductase [Alphaproteobacteria bacterium]|nr:NAD(P)/FAD-dependent oxidoreductase [Alphaproteobacteria bacterium]
MTNNSSNNQDYDAIIVGAGFAGLYQLICLRDQLGLNCLIIETGDDVGGTWYWNRYPGARCDTESHAYSYYFSDELLKEWTWSERYPGHAEIRKYINFVANKFNLKKDILFNEKVINAEFNENSNNWSLATNTGKQFQAKFVIAAVGCLSNTNIPNIKGLDSFEGKYYHTGNWPKTGVSFVNKKVGQIGTGSTGIQAVPVIAAEAKHLTVFQRTANYSIPARNAPLSEEFKDHVKKDHNYYREFLKRTPNGHPFEISSRLVSDVSTEEMNQIYEKAWEKGGLQFRATFNDLVTNIDANKTASEFIKGKIRQTVTNKKFANILSDIDHPYAGKRPPIDSHYFETFNRDNINLIDLRSNPIMHIDNEGIQTKENHYDLDIIVFATGYDAMTGPLLNMNITGKQNLKLKDYWKEGPQTFLGLQIPGFPNLFTITGPGSPSVLTNMPMAIEQHVEWVRDCISFMNNKNHSTIEADSKSADKWGDEVNAVANKTLLPTVKHSWYLGANIPGKPQVFMPYAGGLPKYTKACNEVKNNNYKGFNIA